MSTLSKKQNIVDLLLNADLNELERPSKIVEIKRLSEIFGSEFKVKCIALTPAKDAEISDMCISFDEGMKTDIDISEMQVLTLIEGVCDLEGKPLFKNKELMDKFGSPTPKELIRKVLLPGEQSNLYKVIQDAMGYGKGTVVEEVKN
jgi:hypothetical protein